MDGPKEDAPGPVADFLEPNSEAPEELRDPDFLPLPADGGVLRDEPELEVIGKGDLGRPPRERPEWELVYGRRRLLIERLIGSFLVVDPPEGVEGALLDRERGSSTRPATC
ncbi:MAG: hypothetical protein V3S52_00160 [Gemmatimonadota bacterium]